MFNLHWKTVHFCNISATHIYRYRQNLRFIIALEFMLKELNYYLSKHHTKQFFVPTVSTEIVSYYSHCGLLPSANEVWDKVICLQVCVCPQGDCYPSMHCRWYPACLAAGLQGGLQAHTQGGSGGGSCPGPHPRGKWRGIWSRPTAKGEVEGDLVQAHSQGGS